LKTKSLTGLLEVLAKSLSVKTLTISPIITRLVVVEDVVKRGKDLSVMPPNERLQRMLQHLEDDPIYAKEYSHFVTGMSYAPEDNRPSFSQALSTARHIVSGIESAFANSA
jgi:hypothetical protein